jgi:hypothetical protein
LKSSLDITHSIQSYFENIAESYNNTEESYIVGQIRFETLQKITQLFDISFVVFNTVSETFKENT